MTRANAITFLGDVFLTAPVRFVAPIRGAVVCNLEAPITRRTKGYPGKVNQKSLPEAFDPTFSRPPLAVCIANNHIMDYGPAGLADTLAFLEERGIRYFGAGLESENCNNPLLVRTGGFTVGLMGYVCQSSSPVYASGGHPGTAPIELELIRADMAEARRLGAESIVVHLHWGAEQVTLPKPADIETARTIIDDGADLVIGHHAHCIQAYETYRGRHIFYGLGNCIFPGHSSPAYFDENGTPARVHVSRPTPWNRHSLAVTFDPMTRRATVDRLVFSRGVVDRFPGKAGHYLLDAGRNYPKRYERAFRWGKLRRTMARYLSRPSLPSVRHFSGLIRLIRRDAYE
jgi:hypothetical protein